MSNGRFVREFWYEHKKHFPNKPLPRLRVSSPEAVVHEQWGEHPAVRDNGLATIDFDLLPASLDAAELYLEVWMGHPGTVNHRVTVNGRSTYTLPTKQPHAVGHRYPTIPIERTDLSRDVVALQFGCDIQETFWAHYLLEGACIRAIVPADHEAVGGHGEFTANVVAEASQERVHLELKTDGDRSTISRVDYLARYKGFASGGGDETDWHGFTLQGQPHGIVASVTDEPFDAEWDVSMLPDQEAIDVKARVHLGEPNTLVYETPVIQGVPLKRMAGATVTMHGGPSMWVRDGRDSRMIGLPADFDAASVERAQLTFSVWDGGSEAEGPPYLLNGHGLPLDSDGEHKSRLMTCDVPADVLRAGDNEFTVVAPTKHHGLEVLLPGPALLLRRRA